MSKLFDDMTPLQKHQHCKRCIDEAYRHLQAEHGPVLLADIHDVWDYWAPYLLERVAFLEAVLVAARASLLPCLDPMQVADGFNDCGECVECKLREAIRLCDSQDDGKGEGG